MNKQPYEPDLINLTGHDVRLEVKAVPSAYAPLRTPPTEGQHAEEAYAEAIFRPSIKQLVIPADPSQAQARIVLRTSVGQHAGVTDLLLHRGVHIPCNTIGIFETVGLPPEDPSGGVLFIVSWPVARENLDRHDLLVVNGRLRDGTGKVYAATSLAVLKKHGHSSMTADT